MIKSHALKIRLATILGTIAVVVTFFGNGCGGFRSEYTQDMGVASQDIKPGEKTLAITHFGNILKSFDNLVNPTNANNVVCSSRTAVQRAYTDNAGAFSLDGQTATINAPLQMAIIKVASEYCACAQASQSTLFKGIDFTKASNQYTADVVSTVGANMANVFWGGQWDGAYSADLLAGVVEIASTANTGTAATTVTVQAAIGACTAMLSSFYSIQM